MRLIELKFGALLSYTPRGDSKIIQQSKDVMYYLKKDAFLPKTQILMSQWVAQIIKKRESTLPFSSFFHPNTTIVPTPSSSLMKADTLWVPYRVATALAEIGLGKEVVRCLRRDKPVPKAAYCEPWERPTVAQHYDTIAFEGSLSEPNEIVLVDDIVTRGATLLGAANRLVDAFPDTPISAFAVMRTISNEDEFEDMYAPCVGTITLDEYGNSFRRP